MPGAVLMWWEYMFPSRGQVYATGRRHDNRIVQFLYTMGLYVGLAVLGVIFLGPALGPKGSGGNQPAPAAVAEPVLPVEERAGVVADEPIPDTAPDPVVGTADDTFEDDTAVENTAPDVLVSNEDAVRAALATGSPQTWQAQRESGSVSLSTIQKYSGRECRMVRVVVARSGGQTTTTDQLACRQDGDSWRYPTNAEATAG
jgi:hypothetical protein